MLFLTNGFICLFYENKFMLISGGHISNRSIGLYKLGIQWFWDQHINKAYFLAIFRELPSVILKSASQAVLNGMLHLVLWQIVPGIICDAAFYWMFFLSPIAAWKNLKAGILNVEGEHQFTRVFFSWVWRNARVHIHTFHALRHN